MPLRLVLPDQLLLLLRSKLIKIIIISILITVVILILIDYTLRQHTTTLDTVKQTRYSQSLFSAHFSLQHS